MPLRPAPRRAKASLRALVPTLGERPPLPARLSITSLHAWKPHTTACTMGLRVRHRPARLQRDDGLPTYRHALRWLGVASAAIAHERALSPLYAWDRVAAPAALRPDQLPLGLRAPPPVSCAAARFRVVAQAGEPGERRPRSRAGHVEEIAQARLTDRERPREQPAPELELATSANRGALSGGGIDAACYSQYLPRGPSRTEENVLRAMTAQEEHANNQGIRYDSCVRFGGPRNSAPGQFVS
jgi:hypothetical protein